MPVTDFIIAVKIEKIGLRRLTDEQLQWLIFNVTEIQKQRIDEKLQAKLHDDWATDGGPTPNCLPV